MKNANRLIGLGVFAILLFFYSKCSERGKFQGYEYMPDMAHAVSYEAQYDTYYGHNQKVSYDEYRKFADPRLPAAGSIPRGAEVYHYTNTEEDRLRATNDPELKASLHVKLDKTNMAKAEQLYKTFCGVCHGDAGDGNGVLYNGGESAYPAKPTSYMDSLVAKSGDGRIYHAIMYGRNVMGGYKHMLSPEERWLVVAYIRYLENKTIGEKLSQDDFMKKFNGL